MIIIGILLLLLPGILAAKYFLNNEGVIEQLGMTVFFSLIAVPFLNINYALITKNHISYKLSVLTSIFLIIFFSIMLYLDKEKKDSKKAFLLNVTKEEKRVLILTGLVALFSFCYYTNKEFVLSLGSYLIKGNAKCFYLQTFETIKELAPNFPDKISTNKVYEIICTPGNILFTATFVAIFKYYGFKILYILMVCLLFIFSYLLAKKLINNTFIALLIAIFAVLNPYMLSIEVLDRNTIALTISVIVIYLVLQYKDKLFLHGLVFGILAGTGLRFLPLLFSMPIIIIYYKNNQKLKAYLTFIFAFAITFAFNIPHLYYHGFHSLGESSSTLNLISEAFTKWSRTPFLPFPNLLFYLINILNYFGYLVSGIILLGVYRLGRKGNRFLGIYASVFLAILFVLSYQRNWVESDKSRIIISGFLPLYIFLAHGLEAVWLKRSSLKKLVEIGTCLLILFLFVRVVAGLNFGQDEKFFSRKYLYQTESENYYQLTKGLLLKVELWPNYKRLFSKIKIKHKALEEKIVVNKLFPKGKLPGQQVFNSFYLDRQAYFLKDDEIQLAGSAAGYNFIKIDFEKLVTQPDKAVEKIEYADLCSLDLAKEKDLFDVYYAELNTNWQKELLPVTVIINREEIKYLKELNIDLNAFISLAKEEEGFDLIYPINFKDNLLWQKNKVNLKMNSFPLFSEKNVMIFKIPANLKIIIRNWLINEKGVPYKADSWCIQGDKRGNYKTEFNYNEPESYF